MTPTQHEDVSSRAQRTFKGNAFLSAVHPMDHPQLSRFWTFFGHLCNGRPCNNKLYLLYIRWTLPGNRYFLASNIFWTSDFRTIFEYFGPSQAFMGHPFMIHGSSDGHPQKIDSFSFPAFLNVWISTNFEHVWPSRTFMGCSFMINCLSDGLSQENDISWSGIFECSDFE